jgi:hypothetical protein
VTPESAGRQEITSTEGVVGITTGVRSDEVCEETGLVLEGEGVVTGGRVEVGLEAARWAGGAIGDSLGRRVGFANEQAVASQVIKITMVIRYEVNMRPGKAVRPNDPAASELVFLLMIFE